MSGLRWWVTVERIRRESNRHRHPIIEAGCTYSLEHAVHGRPVLERHLDVSRHDVPIPRRHHRRRGQPPCASSSVVWGRVGTINAAHRGTTKSKRLGHHAPLPAPRATMLLGRLKLMRLAPRKAAVMLGSASASSRVPQRIAR